MDKYILFLILSLGLLLVFSCFILFCCYLYKMCKKVKLQQFKDNENSIEMNSIYKIQKI